MTLAFLLSFVAFLLSRTLRFALLRCFCLQDIWRFASFVAFAQDIGFASFIASLPQKGQCNFASFLAFASRHCVLLHHCVLLLAFYFIIAFCCLRFASSLRFAACVLLHHCVLLLAFCFIIAFCCLRFASSLRFAACRRLQLISKGECSLILKLKCACNQIQDVKRQKKDYMAYFDSLHSHLQVLSKDDLKGHSLIEHGFRRAFHVNLCQMTDTYFVEYTGLEVQHFIDTLLQHLLDLFPLTTISPQKPQQKTQQCNWWTTAGQQHTEQPEIIVEGRVDHSDSGKGFCNCCFKNDLRKLKGNSVDTKFDKTSVLGKPVLPSLRNQSVVRQPNAFKSERAQMSKQRFASQVDVNKNLSKPVTQHYLPKKTESAFAKPDHMIASSSSRNSSKTMPRFSHKTWFYISILVIAKK
ncbi:hypothetical protein Tco_0763709 [Tanacetum coccineum]